MLPRYLPSLLMRLTVLILLLVGLHDSPPPVVAQRLTPIYQIQGNGATTPLLQKWLDTYGVVTGVTATGFYLQDPTGDGDAATSDGIFVYTNKRPTVQPGQCVQLQRAYVDEFYEKTELSRLKAIYPLDLCPATTVAPMLIPAARLAMTPTLLFEQYEGMLVQVADLVGIVQGPTKRFAEGDVEIAFVPEVAHPYLADGRVFQAAITQTQALMHISSALGATLPEVGWGDRVLVGASADEQRQTTAILDYNFGKYQLLLLPDQPVAAERVTPVEERSSPATPDDLTVCTMNLYGLGRGTAQFADEVEYLAQVRKRALAISERLSGCTIIGLQETGTPQDAANLSLELQTTFQLPYTATALAGPQTANPEFPLTNSLLTRTDRVQVQQVALRQACSAQDYEVLVLPDDCPAGQFALFDRPPLVVDLLGTGAWGEPFPLRVLVNHWKSKGGDEKVNVVRRELQARHVATLVQEAQAIDPTRGVIVLGDLNDYYRSGPVEALRTGVQPRLVHTYDFLPALDRYTYIFNGASQVLDHILITPNLLPTLAEVDPVHINANFPYPVRVDFSHAHHASDHDPVQIRLLPTGAAMLGGNLGYGGITVQLHAAAGQLLGETRTDALGDFRFWNLALGPVKLTLHAPDFLELAATEQTMMLLPGYNELDQIPVYHQANEVGIAAALTGAALAANVDK